MKRGYIPTVSQFQVGMEKFWAEWTSVKSLQISAKSLSECVLG